jgi:hypothetical protein
MIKEAFKGNPMTIKIIINAFVFVIAMLLPFSSAVAKIDLVTLSERISVQTTIYNKADLTLFHDKRVLSFVKGMNQLQFSWANTKIDPTSLSLEIKEFTDKIDVVEITYPPLAKDMGIWHIKADDAYKVPVEITYFTSGISWKSYYKAFLSKDEKTCDLKGYVKVTNLSGEDYNNAQTRLVVGKINILDEIGRLAAQKYPYGRPEYFAGKSDRESKYKDGIKKINMAKPGMVMESAIEPPRRKKIEKQGLSEYFLYTIEGEETIPHGWSKRLLSFEAKDIKVKNIYKYEQDRFGKNVIRFLTFTNDKKNNLGLTPLPGGEIKVFHSLDEAGNLDFIGSDETKYIPVSKKVELNLGSSLKVKVSPKVMAYKKENIIFDKKGDVSGFDEIKEFEIQISNFTGLEATIEYVKNLKVNSFKISNMTHPEQFERIDQNTFKFKMELDPDSVSKIRFTMTTKTGERRW